MSDEERRALYRRALGEPEGERLVASAGLCAPLENLVTFEFTPPTNAWSLSSGARTLLITGDPPV